MDDAGRWGWFQVRSCCADSRVWMRLVACVSLLITTACSGGGTRAGEEEIGSSQRVLAERVSGYLDGSLSLTDVTSVLEIPVPAFWEREKREQWVQEARTKNNTLDEDLLRWRHDGYDNAHNPKVLSLAELASFFAARDVLAGRDDLRDTFEAPQGDLWWAYALAETGDSFHSYFVALWNDQLTESATSRISPLVLLHASLYDLLYCTQKAGVDVSGIAGMMVEELYLESSVPTDEISAQRLLQNRMSDAGISRGEFDEALSKCQEDAGERIWPLPYDLDEAFEIRRSEIVEHLTRWTVDNKHIQPPDLTIVQ